MQQQLVGQTIKGYTINDEIGEGGFGVVYRAHQAVIERTVAVKAIWPTLADDPEFVRRFETEAQMIAGLEHPQIVPIYDYWRDTSGAYLVMRWFRNGSLADAIKAKKKVWSVEDVTQLLDQVTAATNYAHRYGIVHRDIKPENILLDDDGNAYLTDFGIARTFGPSSPDDPWSATASPAYGAPEQLEGKAAVPQTDQYSLGLIIYELLAGQHPFPDLDKLTYFELRDQRAHSQIPPLTLLRSDLPQELNNVLGRATALEPKERYQDMLSFAKAFREALVGRTLPARIRIPNNLPAPSGSFIGRESEQAKITEFLQAPNVRLVTILGLGGMGKTRLALEIGARQLDQFRDGVYFVSLVAINSAYFIVSTIAEAIKFSFYRAEDPEAQLLDYLREKKMLLIMDNFEHLLPNTTIITDILGAAPDLKILATCRENLNLQGEYAVRIEGMELPDEENLTEAMNASIVKLFMQSATRVKPDFVVTEEDLPHLTYICRYVSGMPLGILLAASWVEVLSLQEIVQELSGSLDFLTTDMRDMPSRHRSIRAVFDYSWNLLSPEEREVYKKLAIFRNGFSREAAQTVTGASLLALNTLVKKSLIRRDTGGRYEIHEMLRQYGEEKLADPPELKAIVQEAHCKYYTAFMKAREPYIRAEKEIVVMPEIEQEFDNIRLAWEWAVDNGRETEIRNMIFSLDRFMGLRSLFGQKLDMFRSAAEKLEKLETDPENPSLRLGVILGPLSICFSDVGDQQTAVEVSDRAIAILRRHDAPRELGFALLLRNWIVADLTEKVQLLEESWAIFRELNETTYMGSAILNLSMVCRWRGDYEKSDKYMDEAVALGKKVGDRLVIVGQADFLGNAAIMQGNYVEARQHFEEGLRMYRELNSPAGIADFLARLAWVACWEGKYAEAEQGVKEALSMSRALGFRMGIIFNTKDLAVIVYLQGRYAESKQLSAEALELAQKANNALAVSSCLNNLGRASAALGQYSEAITYLRKSLVPSLGSQALSYALETLAVWADILAKQGNAQKAAEILSFAMHYPNVTMENRYFADNQYVALKEMLSPEALAAAEEKGKTLQLDALAHELLSE